MGRVLKKFTSVCLTGVISVGFGLLQGGTASAKTSCDLETIQGLAPSEAIITLAEPTADPVPHCKIEGHIITTDPGPNQVNFRLQLPDENWNNRFYFIGLGGTAGYLPTDSQIPSGNPMVKGFAVAGSDTGHQNGSLDWSFLGKSEAKALDHRNRGAHVSTVAAQAITKAYYNADELYRYHSGCSGGGRMGMEAILNYPEDYDGVLLGEPGIGPTFGAETMVAFIHMSQELTREPGAFVSPEKLVMLDQKVTEHCDPLDGAKDGVVWEHEVCSFDFSTLLCEAEETSDCLTEPQLKTVEAIAAGPRDPNGKIKDGFPITNMSTWATFTGAEPPPWPAKVDPLLATRELPKTSIGYIIGDTQAKAFFGPEFNSLTDFDFKDPEQMDRYWAAAKRVNYGDPFSTDLSNLQKSGGKVLFWNGVSASCCLDQDLLKYYNTASESVGGLKNFQKFAAFYKVPAIGHCGGGTGPQDHADRLFETLIEWVEEGKEPAGVVSNRGSKASQLFTDPNTGSVSGVVVPPSAGSDREFLLCPYPTIAKFNGKKGGEMDAANWACK